MPDDYLGGLVEYTDPETGRRHVSRFEEICDFCCDQHVPIHWAYPCGEVEIIVNDIVSRSDDAWGACKDCFDLIEAGDYEALILRVEKVQIERYIPDLVVPPEIMEEARQALRTQFALFRDARIGPGMPDAEYNEKRKRGEIR